MPPRRRALVVDAVAVTRRFLVGCLAEAGWAAAEAGGAGQALTLLDEGGEFDLLVADLRLPPGPDGMALIAAARARRPGLPAVLLAGPEAPPDLAPAARRGGFVALRKPVSPAELAGLLAALPRGPGS